MTNFIKGLAVAAGVVSGVAAASAADLKIALIYGKTGPLEAYAKQTETGLRLGLEYATKGTMEVDGRKIVIITKDDQSKPDLAKTALAEAYEDDDADIAIGTSSSAAAIAMLPVAEEHKKILIVEPAVADQITGDKWNRYIFRTGRNSSQDAISNAVAIGKPGVTVATLAQDYAFGRDGVAAFKEALAKTGATLVAEEYAPANDHRLHRAGPAPVRCAEGQARPQDHLGDLGWRRRSAEQACRISTPAATASSFRRAATSCRRSSPTSAFPAWKARPITTTASRRTRPTTGWSPSIRSASTRRPISSPPAAFPPRWRSSTAVEKAKSTDTEKLIAAMEGMEFDTPKGKMIFRKEDHQALQIMYHFKIKVDPDGRLGAFLELGARAEDRGHGYPDPQQAMRRSRLRALPFSPCGRRWPREARSDEG